jgi:hypothetical protein
MEVGGWLALAEPQPLDALALAFFSHALFSPPFIRLSEPAVTPTIDLTIHFRARLERPDEEERNAPSSDGPGTGDVEHCFARFTSRTLHEGFFEEDGVIWRSDGTVLAHSRQLAIVLPGQS